MRRRACLLLVLLSQLLSADVLGGKTRVVQFRGLSTSDSPGATNWSTPKVFYIQNNLEGDVEFRESPNATVMVYISESEEDSYRVHVHYDLLEDGKLVDLQVYSKSSSQDSSIILTASLLVAVLTLLCALIGFILWLRGRKQKNSTKEGTRGPDSCKKTTNAEEMSWNASESSRQQLSRLASCRSASRSPLSARAVLVLLALAMVAVATKCSSRAHVVISLPSYLVKNGSTVFFSEVSFGKLLFSSDWRGDPSFVQQFAVPKATSVVPAVTSCPASCQFACDRKTRTCICRRGYELQEETCQDLDECTRLFHNCHAQATCINTVGSFMCKCQNNHWGDGITCTACSKEPCPSGFYESHPCTAVQDRVCSACSPKCDKNTYEVFGCGLNFDRHCVEIGLSLTQTKLGNRSENLKVRHGSKLTVHIPLGSVLIEDQLKVNSTTTTVTITSEESKTLTLHRSSGFHLDVILDELKLIPSYKDARSPVRNENKAFVRTPGFGKVRNNFCRYPAPNYYTLSHTFHKKRQTEIRRAVCSAATPELCPDQVYPGDVYYYRTLNDPCRTAKSQAVCQKNHQELCFLKKQEDKLFCTTYTHVLSDVFGVRRPEFNDQQQHTFPTTFCAQSYSTCQVCKNNCSACVAKSGRQSCPCCFRKCLPRCQSYYEEDCIKSTRQCAVGDTSEFKLTVNRPSNLLTKFNCYLERETPKRLYKVRYRVRHNSSRYQSGWVVSTFDFKGVGRGSPKHASMDTNILDGLEIIHSVNVNLSTFLFLRGERNTQNDPYVYQVANMLSGISSGSKLWKGGPVKIQPVRPFSINTARWGQSENCWKLSKWNSLFQKTFDYLNKTIVQTKGSDSSGAFGYALYDPTRPPTLTLKTSYLRSLLRSVANGTIKNDNTFKRTLSRSNSTWTIRVSGNFNSCPGFLGVRATDETDNVKIVEHDILVLCPNRSFLFDIKTPRKGLQDKERLFSLFLMDPQKEFKFQLAIVDKRARKSKLRSVQHCDESRKNPWWTLMPLFVTTGLVVTALLLLLVYAQVTKPKEEECKVHLKSGWQIVRRKGRRKIPEKAEMADDKTAVRKGVNHRETDTGTADKLKRRHLLLVTFFVVARIVYSLVFTFTMGFAVLSLLHSNELQTLRNYKDFVQGKVKEGNNFARAIDNFRERESKRILDQFEDIQRSCDYFMNLQFNWFRQNMSCILLENQVNIFNKLSEKFSQKITHKLGQMKKKVEERARKFSSSTNLKISHHVDGIQNYGERVYRNGWFSLPTGVFDSFRRRRKREIGPVSVNNLQDAENIDLSLSVEHLQRQRRSTGFDKFVGFLDFVGVLEKDKLEEVKDSISTELKFLMNDVLDFSHVLKVKNVLQYPLSTVSMCPLEYIKEHVAQRVKQRAKELAERADKLARTHASCIYTNTKNLSNYKKDTEKTNTFFPERIIIQDETESSTNTSSPHKADLLNSAHGSSHYDIHAGDHAEEELERGRLQVRHRQGKLDNLTEIYDQEVFLTTKQAVWSVLAIIDILLLVYRSTKTYQIGIKLIEGVTDVVEHDHVDFQNKNNQHIRNTTTFLRHAIDLLTQSFAKVIQCCKNLQKKVLRTNLLPLCIVGAAISALLYLIIAVVFNVMNVTVIEELGGFRLISARLEADMEFTNVAIADQLDVVNRIELPFYRSSVNHTLSEFRGIIEDFNNEQEQRIREVNKVLCDLEYNQTTCIQFIRAELLDFHLQPCIFPDIEAMQFEDYDGNTYRQQLKYESKQYVDAARAIILNTVYFIIAATFLAIIVSLLSLAVFIFMKTRGMLRMKTVHLYSNLTQEVLQHFKPHKEQRNEEVFEIGQQNHNKMPQKIDIPKVFQKD